MATNWLVFMEKQLQASTKQDTRIKLLFPIEILRGTRKSFHADTVRGPTMPHSICGNSYKTTELSEKCLGNTSGQQRQMIYGDASFRPRGL